MTNHNCHSTSNDREFQSLSSVETLDLTIQTTYVRYLKYTQGYKSIHPRWSVTFVVAQSIRQLNPKPPIHKRNLGPSQPQLPMRRFLIQPLQQRPTKIKFIDKVLNLTLFPRKFPPYILVKFSHPVSLLVNTRHTREVPEIAKRMYFDTEFPIYPMRDPRLYRTVFPERNWDTVSRRLWMALTRFWRFRANLSFDGAGLTNITRLA